MKLMPLSKEFKQFIESENYLLYKKFIQLFSINMKAKRSMVPALTEVLQLTKECVQAADKCTSNSMDLGAQKIVMFAFYSDGGTNDINMTYFMHRIFDDTGSHLYSTKSILNPLKNPVHL